MYNPLIKNKWALVDLAKYGTRARKSIHSDVLIGDHPPYPIFKEGDLLDANATFNLIQDSYDQGRVYKILSSLILQSEEHIDNVEKTVSANKQAVDDAITEIVNDLGSSIQNLDNRIQHIELAEHNYDAEIEEIKTTHKQDMINMKTYIDNQLDQFALSNRFVYDGLEENLIIIK